jgi:hypothetical protein
MQEHPRLDLNGSPLPYHAIIHRKEDAKIPRVSKH